MKFLIANWKQNGNLKEVAEFCRALNQSDSIDSNEIILSFPFCLFEFGTISNNKRIY